MTALSRRRLCAGSRNSPPALEQKAALCPNAIQAERKGIASPLVEDIFIAPDIEAPNVFYRATLYFARANPAASWWGPKRG